MILAWQLNVSEKCRCLSKNLQKLINPIVGSVLQQVCVSRRILFILMTGSEFFVTLIFLGSLDRIVFLELKKFWINKSHNLNSYLCFCNFWHEIVAWNKRNKKSPSCTLGNKEWINMEIKTCLAKDFFNFPSLHF